MGKPKSPPGTWFKKEIADSKAYIALSGFAPQLLTLFFLKRQFEYVGRKGKQKWICVNCDSLNFTYIEAKNKYSVTKSRFTRAIDELLAKGFISIEHHGGACQQDKTIYALSDKYLIWKKGTVFETRPKRKVQRGFCKPKTKLALVNVPIHTLENVPIEDSLDSECVPMQN